MGRTKMGFLKLHSKFLLLALTFLTAGLKKIETQEFIAKSNAVLKQFIF
jgi:hypothetical protein